MQYMMSIVMHCVTFVLMFATSSAAPAVPSNLLLVGGFHKCGSSHLHRVLASHPKVFALRKEIKPLSNDVTAEKLFEQVVFFYARELMNDDYTDLAKIKGACKRHFSERAEAKEECLRLMSLNASPTLESPKLLLLTSLKFLKYPELVNRWGATVKAMFIVRDPAEYLWAAFNYWIVDMDVSQKPHKTTNRSYRSPELFHELLLAEGRLSWMLGKDGRTGEWFFLVQNGTMRKSVKHLLVLRSEDFLDPDLTMLALGKVSSFTTLELAGFNKSVLSSRTNSQYSVSTKGAQSAIGQDVPAGVYEISGYRPMLCRSRYNITYTACLSANFMPCDDHKSAESDCNSSHDFSGVTARLISGYNSTLMVQVPALLTLIMVCIFACSLRCKHGSDVGVV
ncbi:unnamed protein product [Durusdinium trenchii]|uniref:Sulfotransferase n=1 Tax=Durusdinium trenchii TaxID=1381693 RepID=A0ABP0H8S0_9DINO